jgi:hypothetical protein
LGFRVFFTVVGLVLALIAWPADARADPQQDLALAETRFQNGRYEEAAAILGPMLAEPLDPTSPDAERRKPIYHQARPLYAACLVALGREDEADAVILEQYRADPFYEVPPGRFPQPVVDRFIRVATSNRAQIEAWRQTIIDQQQERAAQRAELERRRTERLAQLEAMAAEEKTVIYRSRWLAAVPFGVGQFQNGDVGLGVFFAASEVLTIASGVTSFIIADNVPDCSTVPPTIDQESGEPIDCGRLETRFQVARAVNWVSLGSAAALLIGGIIEAQVSFEGKQVQTRKRELPPPVEISPDASISDQGAIFGLRGRF